MCTATTIGLVLQAALPLAPGTRLLVALAGAFVMSIGSGVRWGLLAEVLPRGQYALARSAMNVSVGVMQVLGFAVGGSLLHLLAVEQVLWVAAALAALAVPITWTGVGDRRPRRTGRTGLGETWRGNRILLTLPSTRPLLLALTIPNGLVAGCEALFVPYAGDAAAALFVAGAAGMLVGDVLVGRVLDASAETGVGEMAALVAGGAVPLLRRAPGPAGGGAPGGLRLPRVRRHARPAGAARGAHPAGPSPARCSAPSPPPGPPARGSARSWPARWPR